MSEADLLRLIAEWRRAADGAEHDAAVAYRRCADDLVALLPSRETAAQARDRAARFSWP